MENKKVICVTFPRSGHHLLVRVLKKYFGNKINYCDFYNHCKQVPCIDSKTNLQKNHDLNLDLDKNLNYLYVVQYRNPFESIISWYKQRIMMKKRLSWMYRVFSKIRGKYNKKEWLKFFDEKMIFWKNFVNKWIIENKKRNYYFLQYEEFIGKPEEKLSEIINLINPKHKVNLKKLKNVIIKMKIRERNRSNSFVFYDKNYFRKFRKKFNKEFDYLNL